MMRIAPTTAQAIATVLWSILEFDAPVTGLGLVLGGKMVLGAIGTSGFCELGDEIVTMTLVKNVGSVVSPRDRLEGKFGVQNGLEVRILVSGLYVLCTDDDAVRVVPTDDVLLVLVL